MVQILGAVELKVEVALTVNIYCPCCQILTSLNPRPVNPHSSINTLKRFHAFININYILDGEESAKESTSRQKRGILQKILFLNAFRNVQIPFLG